MGSKYLVMGSALVLSACAALPNRETQPQMRAMETYATERSFVASANGAWPTDSWWLAYQDEQLNALIDEALRGSPTLAAADARVRKAYAAADTTGAARFPQASFNASASEQRQSYNYLTPPEFTPRGWNDYGRATLDLSWELDFWGKNRAALAAATSEAEAAEAERAQARLAIATSVALAYAELAREYAALDTAMAARDVRGKTAELFRARFSNGLETLGSVRQVESRRAVAEADVLSLQEQIALQRNRIAALLGAGPDRGLEIARPAFAFDTAAVIPQHLAADLLGRRPDLASARLRAQASAKRIHVAEAAFYPNVNLVGLIGAQSFGIDMLTKSGSTIGSVGPALSLPIFTGGRLRAQLRGTDADYTEAIANYEHAVVQALQEVADAVTSQHALAPQLAHVDEAVIAAREAWGVQRNRYEGGLGTYLDVLSAEDYLLSNLRTQTDLRSRAFTLDISLVSALGGGYSVQKF